MSEPKSCPVEWCASDHKNDTARIRYHHNIVGQQTANGVTLTIVVRFSEGRDGRHGIGPIVSILNGNAADTIDIGAHEARLWSGNLSALDGSPWLAATLATAAAMVRPYAEPSDLEHRIAESPSALDTTVMVMRAAVTGALETIAAFDKFPVETLTAFDLTNWAMRFRAVTAALAEQVERVIEEGYLS